MSQDPILEKLDEIVRSICFTMEDESGVITDQYFNETAPVEPFKHRLVRELLVVMAIKFYDRGHGDGSAHSYPLSREEILKDFGVEEEP